MNSMTGQMGHERKAVQSGNMRARHRPTAGGTVLPASAQEE